MLHGVLISQSSFYLWLEYQFYFVGCIVFIVIWDIVHEAFLQLLACKEPPCDVRDAQ